MVNDCTYFFYFILYAKTLNGDITSIRSSFQNGVDTLYNKCKSCGSTPSSSTPTAIANAIQNIYTNRYNSGRTTGQRDVTGNPNGWNLYTKTQYDQNYQSGHDAGWNAGYSAGQNSASGSYTITFLINAHDNESPMNWLKYNDQITLNIANNTATLGTPSFMNAQIRSEFGEYYNIKKN